MGIEILVFWMLLRMHINLDLQLERKALDWRCDKIVKAISWIQTTSITFQIVEIILDLGKALKYLEKLDLSEEDSEASGLEPEQELGSREDRMRLRDCAGSWPSGIFGKALDQRREAV